MRRMSRWRSGTGGGERTAGCAVDYRIDVYDTWGRRVARFHEAPLLDAERAWAGQADHIAGLLPVSIDTLGPGYRVELWLEGRKACVGYVTQASARWSDTKKLILDRYVRFHELVAFETEARFADVALSQLYQNRTVGAIVKDAIQRAISPIHYNVAHEAYPDGARREYQKFLTRKTDGNALAVGGIASGQWAGGVRVDASGAYAKDGRTIAGLVVDGVAWPDLRLLMLDCESLALDAEAVARHPETEEWTAARYAASGYALNAKTAKEALQAWLDEKGVDYVELNPHRNARGAYDFRMDAAGRYVGLAYGGGECVNAAMVEQGAADVELPENGALLKPEMALKDFLSYRTANTDSVSGAATVLGRLDYDGGLFGLLALLAYAAGGHVWSLDVDGAVSFGPAQVKRVAFANRTRTGVELGASSEGIVNELVLSSDPVGGALRKTYVRAESVALLGAHASSLEVSALRLEEDADRLAAGLLDDVAYPGCVGTIEFYAGDAHLDAGDIIEVRGSTLKRLDAPLDGEWGSRFAGRLAGRVARVSHRLSGRSVQTVAELASPLRSVAEPLGFLQANQPGADYLSAFSLDEEAITLDAGLHLDA